MQIQINFGDVNHSDALNDHVHKEIETALKLFAERITRVEVHLRDDKQNRRGPDDKRATLEARIAGEQPLAVEAKSDDIYKAVTDAAGKLGRAVERKIARRAEG